jgi:hypothetical protein
MAEGQGPLVDSRVAGSLPLLTVSVITAAVSPIPSFAHHQSPVGVTEAPSATRILLVRSSGQVRGCQRVHEAVSVSAEDVIVDQNTAGAGARQRIREARLKPEFAHLYPALEADCWAPAAMMADRVVAWLLRQPDRGYVAPERVLKSEHFEFRGGIDHPGTEDAHRRRQPPAGER